LEHLIGQLADEDAQIRAEARKQLVSRGEDVIPHLVEAMESVSERARFEISKVLADMGEASLMAMTEAIQHPSAHVRAVAARVLSLIGGEPARKHLEDIARREKRKTVRKELREAAAQIGRRLENVSFKSRPRASLEGLGTQETDGLSPKEREEKTLYFNIVRNLILSNWSKPRLFPSDPEAEEVLVTLKVDRDGSVSRVLIENKWQNSPLGESLKDAIRRSTPFPPVPEPVARGKHEVDITFILPIPA
jgi:hypothetical protein